MCVIVVADKGRPAEYQIDHMWETNEFGGGAAWREGAYVRWRKGLTLEQMKEMAAQLPMPFILHFRTPSANTSMLDEACHPFPIEPKVRVDLEGKIKGLVLFHNGNWTGWRHEVKEMAGKNGWPVPTGPWSDTRAIAWAAAHLSPGYLEMIDQKVVILGPREDELEFFGDISSAGGWQRSGNFWVSNMSWVGGKPKNRAAGYNPPHNTQSSREMLPGLRETTGGSPAQQTFHGTGSTHQTAGGGGDQPKAVQAGDEKTLAEAISEAASAECVGTEKALWEWAISLNPSLVKSPRCTVAYNKICVTEGCKKEAQYWNRPDDGTCFDCHNKKESARIAATMSKDGSYSHKACETCNRVFTPARIRATNAPICFACWKKNDRPHLSVGDYAAVDDDPVRARRQADAARGIEHLGPM